MLDSLQVGSSGAIPARKFDRRKGLFSEARTFQLGGVKAMWQSGKEGSRQVRCQLQTFRCPNDLNLTSASWTARKQQVGRGPCRGGTGRAGRLTRPSARVSLACLKPSEHLRLT